VNDAGELLDLSEEQGAAVGGDVAAVEGGEDLAGAEGGEVEVGGAGGREVESRSRPDPAAGGKRSGPGITLCGHRVSLR